MVRLFLVAVIAIFGLAACGEKPGSASNSENTGAPAAYMSREPGPAPAPVPALIEPPAILAEPEPARRGGSPSYTYRLTNPEIGRYHEEALSIAVSSKLNKAELSQLLTDYQKALQAAHPQIDSGSLLTGHWSTFKFVLAKINCPTFLKCEGDQHPKSTDDDPLIWNWKLNGTQWDATQSSSISVAFFGGQSISDKFDEEIDTLPPLEISVKVNRDIDWWEKLFNQLKDLFISIKGALQALAGVVLLVLGWFGWKKYGTSRKPK